MLPEIDITYFISCLNKDYSFTKSVKHLCMQQIMRYNLKWRLANYLLNIIKIWKYITPFCPPITQKRPFWVGCKALGYFFSIFICYLRSFKSLILYILPIKNTVKIYHCIWMDFNIESYIAWKALSISTECRCF